MSKIRYHNTHVRKPSITSWEQFYTGWIAGVRAALGVQREAFVTNIERLGHDAFISWQDVPAGDLPDTPASAVAKDALLYMGSDKQRELRQMDHALLTNELYDLLEKASEEGEEWAFLGTDALDDAVAMLEMALGYK